MRSRAAARGRRLSHWISYVPERVRLRDSRELSGAYRQIWLSLEYYAAQHVLSDGSESWEKAMNHRGVEFTVAKTALPGIWQWQFRIGEQIKTGRTETKIDLLAIRRVQLRIDRELKAIGRKTA
jgi:hypothetical protein